MSHISKVVFSHMKWVKKQYSFLFALAATKVLMKIYQDCNMYVRFFLCSQLLHFWHYL